MTPRPSEASTSAEYPPTSVQVSLPAPRREQGPARSDPADPLPDPDAEAHQVFPTADLLAADRANPVPPSPGPVDPQVYVRMGTGAHTWASSYMPKWNADWLVGRLRKLYPDATVEVIE